jgi:hypothetical protein
LTITIVIAVIIALFTVFAAKKYSALLPSILFALITEAEREFGSGTGQLKLAIVLERLSPLIPAFMRPFLTVATLERLIEFALESAKLKWTTNPKLIHSA